MDGAERATTLHDTQAEGAAEAHRYLAASGGGELRIKVRNGKIRDTMTIPPAKDPYPPKG